MSPATSRASEPNAQKYTMMYENFRGGHDMTCCEGFALWARLRRDGVHERDSQTTHAHNSRPTPHTPDQAPDPKPQSLPRPNPTAGPESKLKIPERDAEIEIVSGVRRREMWSPYFNRC